MTGNHDFTILISACCHVPFTSGHLELGLLVTNFNAVCCHIKGSTPELVLLFHDFIKRHGHGINIRAERLDEVGWCQRVQANLSVAGSKVEFCLGQIRSKDANILLTLTWFSRTNESSPRHISCWLTAHLECSRTSLWFDANF